jgi:glycine cleavage system aminomethyltransferase T
MSEGNGPAGTGESLQQLIDRLPDLVEHFYNDAPAPHFSRAGTGKTAPFIPPAFTNWRDEQRSWAETAALLHQSHHMPELFLDGPDALRLLERLGINTVGNFTVDRAKQFVTCTPAGHVIGDCIAYRLGPESFELVSGMPLQNWVHYHAEQGGYDVQVTRDAPSNLNPAGRRTKYRFQLDGPSAGKIFAAAVDGELPEIGFFRTAHVTIKGHDVLVLRHGMAGHQGVEISGPFADETEVRDAILAAGEPYGIAPVGTQAYFSPRRCPTRGWPTRCRGSSPATSCGTTASGCRAPAGRPTPSSAAASSRPASRTTTSPPTTSATGTW